jgi:hypothetical protein
VYLYTSVSNDRRPILEALKIRRSENSKVLGPRRLEELRTLKRTRNPTDFKTKDKILEA